MLIIEQPSLPIICGTNACVGISVPRKLRLNTNSTPDSSRSKKLFVSASISPISKYSLSVVARGLLPPAPFTKISHLPSSFSTFSATSLQMFLSSTLHLNAFAIKPSACISSATCFAASSFRSRRATFAPARARIFANLAHKIQPAPVTTATFPERLVSRTFLFIFVSPYFLDFSHASNKPLIYAAPSALSYSP